MYTFVGIITKTHRQIFYAECQIHELKHATVENPMRRTLTKMIINVVNYKSTAVIWF